MSNKNEYGTSPVGRIIMGDPWNKQTTDQNNRELPPEKQRFFVGIAIAKDAPGVNEMLGTLQKAATAGYSHMPHVMQQINMGLSATAFSWKVQDGDEMRANPQTGVMEPRTPHGKGCWIFKFSTTLPIRAAKYQGNVPVDCAHDEIKRGYYVQVAYSCSANGNTDHTAGIYLNPQTICLVGFGEEIVSGPALDQQFTSGPGSYVPAGMSTAPQAPTGAPGPMGQQPQQPAPTGMPMGQQPQQPAPTGMPMGQQPQQPAPTGMPMGNQQQPTYGNGMPQPNSPDTATTSGGSPAPAMPYGGFMQTPGNGQ